MSKSRAVFGGDCLKDKVMDVGEENEETEALVSVVFGLTVRVRFRQRGPRAPWRVCACVSVRAQFRVRSSARVPFQSLLSASPRASPLAVLASPDGPAVVSPPRTAGRAGEVVLQSAAMETRRHRSQDGICRAKDLARKSCYCHCCPHFTDEEPRPRGDS